MPCGACHSLARVATLAFRRISRLEHMTADRKNTISGAF
jgi:hypothetical protein